MYYMSDLEAKLFLDSLFLLHRILYWGVQFGLLAGQTYLHTQPINNLYF